MSSFYNHFKQNMDGLGLPAPETLFATLQTAVATATTLLTQVDKFGKAVTIGELIRAGTKMEMLVTVSACSAAFYAGAVIGSIAIATGKCLSGPATIADVLASADQHKIARPWLISLLHHFPGLYDGNVAARDLYQFQRVVV